MYFLVPKVKNSKTATDFYLINNIVKYNVVTKRDAYILPFANKFLEQFTKRAIYYYFNLFLEYN